MHTVYRTAGSYLRTHYHTHIQIIRGHNNCL